MGIEVIDTAPTIDVVSIVDDSDEGLEIDLDSLFDELAMFNVEDDSSDFFPEDL